MTDEPELDDRSEPWRAPPTIRRVTLSDDYHDLLHRLGSRDCRGQGGWLRGPARHVAHRWEFTWGPHLRTWTLCRLGRHAPTTFYHGVAEPSARDDGSTRAGGWQSRQRVCLDCARPLGPVERRPEGGEW